MKDTFFTNSTMAKLIITIASLCFIFIVAMLIGALIAERLFVATIFAFFIIIPLSIYSSSKRKGIIDRIRISSDGITVIRGFNREMVFILWDNIVSIDKTHSNNLEIIRIESNIIFDNKACILFVQSREEIVNLLMTYYSKELINK